MTTGGWVRTLAAVTWLLWTGGCAVKMPPPLPVSPAYPEYLYPVVPAGRDASLIDRGWRFLQAGQLRDAAREFAAAVTRDDGFYPALTGGGYVALARGDAGPALEQFDAALNGRADYVPALVGRGQALLTLEREGDAIVAFEAALAVDATLADVRRRVEVLRFRGLQNTIESGRTAAGAGRLDEAAAAFIEALDASPETAFLHRELGVVEHRRGNGDAALVHLKRAVELDPFDADGFAQLATVLEERGEFAAAEAALRTAADLAPGDELSRRIADLAERAADAVPAAEFRAIPTNDVVSRGDLAALIAVRLGPVLRAAAQRQAVTTDSARHWAREWIAAVVGAGVIEPYANHAFQPSAPVRRVDLALAVNKLLELVSSGDPTLRDQWAASRPVIADVNESHLNHPAVALAVASGVMPLLDGGRFQVNRLVSGIEAVQVIGRVQSLTAPAD